MNVRVFLFLLLVSVHLFVVAVSSTYLSDEYIQDIREKNKLYDYVKKIDSSKEKYHLEYKNFNDLLETVYLVDKYSKYSKFTREEVMAIIFKESRFNSRALNKSDGGRGLGQLTNINVWWKDELFWMTDPYDKDQNIKGIFIVLNAFHRQYGNKQQAIKHYNGSGSKADSYVKDVIKLSKIFS